MRLATAADVAEKAGVSVSSVHNWSSRPHLVGQKMANRIQQAADELGYGNGKVRGRSDEEPHTFGVAIHRSVEDVSCGIFAPMLVALMDEADEHGDDILTFIERENPLQAYTNRWVRGGITGFIIDTVPPDGLLLEELEKLDAPFVLFGKPPRDISAKKAATYSWVDTDNQHGMRLAVDHLRELGHKAITYIGPSPLVDHVTDERHAGYTVAMVRAGLRPISIDAAYDATFADFEEELRSLLDSDQRPTAIATFSDDLAIQVMRYANQYNLEIGGDTASGAIALTGYDNSVGAVISGLTSVRQPIEQLAGQLIIALREKIRRPDHPYTVSLPCQLTETEIRDSTCRVSKAR